LQARKAQASSYRDYEGKETEKLGGKKTRNEAVGSTNFQVKKSVIHFFSPERPPATNSRSGKAVAMKSHIEP
jgi:hypothetical protein